MSDVQDTAVVAPGQQESMKTAINSNSKDGMAAAREALQAKRAPANDASEAARKLGQRSAEVRSQRQAEAQRPQEDGEQPDNTPLGTDGETNDIPADNVDHAETAPVDFDQEALDFGEGVTMTRAEAKQHLMRQADYTQKTQSLADERRAFESDRSARLSVLDAAITHVSQTLGPRKSELQWMREDPIDGRMRYLEQEERFGQIGALSQARQQEQAQHIQQLRSQTLSALSQKYGAEAQTKFSGAIDYLHAQMGGDKAALEATVLHPTAIELLEKARQWDELQSKQKTIQRTVAGKPPVIQPGAKISSQASQQSKFQSAMANLSKSGSQSAGVAALQARRATQGR